MAWPKPLTDTLMKKYGYSPATFPKATYPAFQNADTTVLRSVLNFGSSNARSSSPTAFVAFNVFNSPVIRLRTSVFFVPTKVVRSGLMARASPSTSIRSNAVRTAS